MSEFFNHIVFQNFKSENFENKLVLKDGSTFSERALAVVGIESFINFHHKVYQDSCFSQETGPYFICTGCASLAQLEKLQCTNAQIEHLNSQGLAIYLFEDMYTSVGPKLKNYLEAPQVNSDNTEYYNRYGPSIRGFENSAGNFDTLFSFELESIKEFVNNNNLTNVTVYCGDYNSAKYLQKAYPMFKIATRNLYVISVAKRLMSKTDNITAKSSNLITHKFLSANGKYKAVRHLIVAYLLDKSSILSFDQTKTVWGSLQNQLWFKLSTWNTNTKIFNKLITNIQKLETMPPMAIGDGNIPNPNFEAEFDFAPQSEYERCFCAVVCETKYSHPVATFSEKTLNAIHRHRPFILVAPPHTLEYLKKYGFKTFDAFWDESYDREENHEKRLLKIFKLIDHLDSLPLTTLRNLYQAMTPILEHNYQVIKTIPEAWPK